MKAVWSIVIWFLMLIPMSCSYASEGVITERTALPVKIGNVDVRLETEIVRPSAKGKYPLVLIVNGSSTSPRDAKAEWLERIARDFAHRGWLAASVLWPGYGSSTGVFRDAGGNCSEPHVATFFDARRQELAGAVADLKKRDDVDSSLTLGLGFSIGGGSMLALSANPDRPLNAVINISGGLYHYDGSGVAASDCSLFRQDLVKTVSTFASNGGIPTLWIYAANDPFFPPQVAEGMVASYRAKGGVADFVELPPFEKDGHTLFKDTASTMVNPLIEGFLAKNDLPHSTNADMKELISGMEAHDRLDTEKYLASSTEKAVAATGDEKNFFWTASRGSVDEARKIALSKCNKGGGTGCHIVAENGNSFVERGH